MSMRNYSEDFYYDIYPEFVPVIKQPIYMIVILSIAFGVIFVCSIVGNLLVILVVYRNPAMKNVTNYFIVNLTIADILVAVMCIPLTLLDNIYSGNIHFYTFPLVHEIIQRSSILMLLLNLCLTSV